MLLARRALAGALAGIAPLLLDQALAFATLGYRVHLSGLHAAAYPCASVVAGLAVAALVRTRELSIATLASFAAALLYAGPWSSASSGRCSSAVSASRSPRWREGSA